MCKWRIFRAISLIAVVSLFPQVGVKAQNHAIHFQTDSEEQALCAKGNAMACYKTAFRLRFEAVNEQTKRPLALETYQKACELGNALSCRESIVRFVKFDINNADEKLLDHYRQCQKKSYMDCYWQALTYLYLPEKLSRFKKEPQVLGEKAGALLVKACDEGNLNQACSELGMLLFDAGFQEKAEAYLTKACGNGDAVACSYGGARPLLLKNIDVAVQQLDQGCTLGDDKSCYLLASYLEGARKLDLAKKFYYRSCGAGVMAACIRVATPLIKQNQLTEAESVLKYPCSVGYGHACYLMAQVKKLSFEDPISHYQNAQKVLSENCRSGQSEACGLLKQTEIELGRSRWAQWFDALRYSLAMLVGHYFKVV